MGFTWKDFISGASGSLGQGAQIGLGGMAEMQKRRDAEAETTRKAQQEAFTNALNMNRQKLEEQKYGFDVEKYQGGAASRAIDDRYKTSLTNDLDPNSPDNVADRKYKDAQTYRTMNPIDSASEARTNEFSKLTPEQQENARLVMFGLEPKAVNKKELSPDKVNEVFAGMYDTWQYDGGRNRGEPEPTIQDAVKRLQTIMNEMYPEPLRPELLPEGGPEMLQNLYNGAGNPQNQPQYLVGGRSQPMPQKQLHPALQKMVQGGLTKQDILNDYMANAKEYEANGITLDMIGALAQ